MPACAHIAYCKAVASLFLEDEDRSRPCEFSSLQIKSHCITILSPSSLIPILKVTKYPIDLTSSVSSSQSYKV